MRQSQLMSLIKARASYIFASTVIHGLTAWQTVHLFDREGEREDAAGDGASPSWC